MRESNEMSSVVEVFSNFDWVRWDLLLFMQLSLFLKTVEHKMTTSQLTPGRPSITKQLDREVYQITKKIVDEEEQIPRASVIYQKIKNSNSSLNRRPKRILESSIERALTIIQADEMDEDDLGPIDDEIMPEEGTSSNSNALNRSIVGMWSKPDTNGHPDTIVKPKKRLANGEPSKKRARTIANSPPSDISLADLGGIDAIIEELGDILLFPLKRPEIFIASGIQPTRGVLLHGPPGCGKTMLANAIAVEFRVPFISISAPSIVSGMSGESEKALREHFDEAKRLAPCLMFIDEIDAITPKRESAQREMEKRIVAQLLTCMDDLALGKTGGKAVIVIAATNRPDSLDPALRRGGRFDKEINMSIPNQSVREQILRALTRKMDLEDDVDFKNLAQHTPGFVGADLQDLVSTAAASALGRPLENLKAGIEEGAMEIDNTILSPALIKLRGVIKILEDPETTFPSIKISNGDFLKVLPKIQPSLKREGFATVPDTTWKDIGALTSIRQKLEAAVVDPILYPERYARVGITAPSGVLLWGPPGCGKTLLAKAVANESKANFISIKGPELLNKFVGESERAVRQVFNRARASAPCIIFFDELDALAPRRDDATNESSARVVNTLLTELDGLDSRVGIYVIGATNRPDIIDPAILRPGRLETLLYVDLPEKDERVAILKTLLQSMDIKFDSIIQRVAEECDGFSGADLASLVRHAGLSAIQRDDDLRSEDFVCAKESVKPSVGDVRKYQLRRAAF